MCLNIAQTRVQAGAFAPKLLLRTGLNLRCWHVPDFPRRDNKEGEPRMEEERSNSCICAMAFSQPDPSAAKESAASRKTPRLHDVESATSLNLPRSDGTSTTHPVLGNPWTS